MESLFEYVAYSIKMPDCRRCRCKAEYKTKEGGDGYTGFLEVYCPECGMSSGFVKYDTYAANIPYYGNIFRKAFEQFRQVVIA